MTLASAPASAQYDTRALYDRLDRLERDLGVLQQQNARGGSGPTVVRSPAAGGSDSGSIPSSVAARLEDRIDQLEDQMRQLTGKLEEANFKTGQVAKQLDRMQADIDLRFKDMQAAQAPAQAGGQPQSLTMPAAGATNAAGAPVLIPPKGVNVGGNSADGAGAAPGPQVLGTLSDKDLKKMAPQQAAPASPAAAPQPPAPKDAQGAYDEAYGLAQKGDYNGAEKAFGAFLKQYPNHQLAGNAEYWLGDIAFSQRKDFTEAAKLFADAYKKYPKHTKAPDMLYKLGASFAQLGDTAKACKVFSLLGSEHPDMPDRVKRAVAADKKTYSCK
jgi:tol-pal system protein YbgF